jgi:hypothetical protein
MNIMIKERNMVLGSPIISMEIYGIREIISMEKYMDHGRDIITMES